jgi:hypothetical protein
MVMPLRMVAMGLSVVIVLLTSHMAKGAGRGWRDSDVIPGATLHAIDHKWKY